MLNIIILERNLYYTLGYRYYCYNNIVIYVNSSVYIKRTVRLILFRVGCIRRNNANAFVTLSKVPTYYQIVSFCGKQSIARVGTFRKNE